MSALEVADIFRDHGAAWRKKHAGHISLDQLKVMSAIERCRTAQLGGHVLCCTDCGEIQIAYNSCRNRHCPKCQASAAKRWLDARMEDLLPVDYYHLVFTLPAPIADIAYQNKAVIYNILFKAAAETLTTIAADPKHLGALIGMTMVLHTWGSRLVHHPHVHCIVPGGGFSKDRKQWIACRKGYFLTIAVLSQLFRRLFLEQLQQAHKGGQLHFFGQYQGLEDEQKFVDWIKPLRQLNWHLYAKRPFSGPAAVLEYLSRYTHRVAIGNSRLIHVGEQGVTFKYKDYRDKGRYKPKDMTLSNDEFIRRFLLHVLPRGFHRIRHYGFLANARRVENISHARELLAVPLPQLVDEAASGDEPPVSTYVCRSCEAPMIIIETLAPVGLPRTNLPRAPPIIKAA